MISRAPLSVTFYLSQEDRELFEALYQALTGLSTDHELTRELASKGLIEDGGDGRADITPAGTREILRLRQVARDAFEQRRRNASSSRSSCPAVEPVSGRKTGAGTGPYLLGARSGAPAIQRNVSRAPSTYPTRSTT